jgi:hypothetical protein
MSQLKIIINTTFEGTHFWEEAPQEVSYLKNEHRHLFHVRVEKKVSHAEREIEIILFKRKVGEIIAVFQKYTPGVINWSCEEWAKRLLQSLEADKVEVLEDGENGAIAELSEGENSSKIGKSHFQKV